MKNKNKVREREIEAHLLKEVERLGGKCRKWVSPQNNGVLDRIVQFSEGLIFFVELKAPGGRLSSAQEREISWLHAHGFMTAVLAGKNEVDAFIENVKEGYL